MFCVPRQVGAENPQRLTIGSRSCASLLAEHCARLAFPSDVSPRAGCCRSGGGAGPRRPGRDPLHRGARPPREEIVLRRARMTKAAVLLLAGSMAPAACASDEKNSSSGSGSSGGSSDLKVGIAYDTGGRGDKSFNDSAFAGVEKAVEDHGGKYTELSPNSDASNRADLLTQLADQGYNPIIAVGFAYSQVIGDVAKQYPDVTFAQVDGAVADAGSPKNLTGLLFAENEGSFLAGVAAALKTTSNHIGFVGGVETPLIQKFQAGYMAGAKAAKPDIQVDVQYISPAGDFSGFNDPAKGQIVAQGMFDAGA